jgi:hypothetical protein
VANYLRDGRLPGIKVGVLWRVRLADLDAYIIEKSEAAAVKRDAQLMAAARVRLGLPPKPYRAPRGPRKAKSEGGTP